MNSTQKKIVLFVIIVLGLAVFNSYVLPSDFSIQDYSAYQWRIGLPQETKLVDSYSDKGVRGDGRAYIVAEYQNMQPGETFSKQFALGRNREIEDELWEELKIFPQKELDKLPLPNFDKPYYYLKMKKDDSFFEAFWFYFPDEKRLYFLDSKL